jgi:hypothetical protein
MSVTRVLAIGAFVVGIVLLVVVEWAARRPGSRIPTLGDMAGFVMSYQAGRVPVGRIAVFGFWWWVGWHFFAR